MSKIIIIHDKPKDIENFEKHYYNIHIPLAKKLPKLIGASVHRVVSAQHTDNEPYLVVEVEFNNSEDLHAAMASSEGKAVSEDVKNLIPFLNRRPAILILE
ncbi:EthD family reductase [Paenibacillus glycanilyticus]|uniref:EthD family reductase n=1 Tax=Paenibacillus glycanilyticus TaxID=126569 RepID=UPI00203D16F1|nr:EthD family reductase [Paenibacillus glycanilyticus]MCM3626770.1 EthD family reductase [Paenibacillus glycanilyticus]